MTSLIQLAAKPGVVVASPGNKSPSIAMSPTGTDHYHDKHDKQFKHLLLWKYHLYMNIFLFEHGNSFNKNKNKLTG